MEKVIKITFSEEFASADEEKKGYLTVDQYKTFSRRTNNPEVMLNQFSKFKEEPCTGAEPADLSSSPSSITSDMIKGYPGMSDDRFALMKQGFDEANKSGTNLVTIPSFVNWFAGFHTDLSSEALVIFKFLPEVKIREAHEIYQQFGQQSPFPLLDFHFWCVCSEFIFAALFGLPRAKFIKPAIFFCMDVDYQQKISLGPFMETYVPFALSKRPDCSRTQRTSPQDRILMQSYNQMFEMFAKDGYLDFDGFLRLLDYERNPDAIQ